MSSTTLPTTTHLAFAVGALIEKRDQYLAAQGRLWSLPGEPLIGIVGAETAARWKALGIRAAFLNDRIEDVRRVVVA